MSLYRKLILFMLVVAVAPLSVTGLALMRAAEQALLERIFEAQALAVRTEAEALGEFIADKAEELRRATGHFRLDGVGPDGLQGALRIVYRSVPDVAVAVLLDEEGALFADPVYLENPHQFSDLRDHPAADESSLDRLLAFLPRERAMTEGAGAVVLSAAYGVPERDETALAVALPVEADGRVLVYGVELSLGAFGQRLLAVEGVGAISVLDSDGRFALHPDPSLLRESATCPAYARALAADGAGISRESTLDGRSLVAFAPVPVSGLGWRVVATLPESEAFSAVRRMRTMVAWACGGTVCLLLLLGLAFVRGVRVGLDSVTEGARAFTRGDLDHRITAPSERELAVLAGTFNAMGEELATARARLLRWNETLQEEVEQRTEELKAAQASLLRAQKLAAVGQLGAGVAHEVNSPLSGILGNVQLLLMKKKRSGASDDDPEVKSLLKVEEAAKRCRDITASLLRFSEARGESRRDTLVVNELVRDAVSLFESQTERSPVDLVLDLTEPSPTVVGDGEQLTQVLLHLFSNARTALLDREAGRIEISTRYESRGVMLIVADDGQGIDPAIKDRVFEPFFSTKKVWTSLGLGLSVAYRVIEDHGGAVEIASEPGQGTEVRVLLPGAAGRADEEHMAASSSSG